MAFQICQKDEKEKKTPSYISFVSSTDEDSLTVISSDTCDQEKILKTVLSSQRDPVPDTETRCLSASGSFFFFFFFPAQGRGVLFHPEEI